MGKSKRVNLVFNLDRDYEVYQHLASKSNKTAYVKEAILHYEGLREIQIDRDTLKALLREVIEESGTQLMSSEKSDSQEISDDIFDAISNL